MVLSETLDENAVQILASVAIAERFPEQCDRWRARNQGARTKFMQELMERKETVRKEVIRGEVSLRRVLYEAVVEDVMRLFPLVLSNGTLGHAVLTRALMTGHWSVTASLRPPARELGGFQMRTRMLKVRSLYVRLSRRSPFSQTRCGSPTLNHFTLIFEASITSTSRTPDSALP